ncbi:MAG: hypothetical protein JWO12_2271 [Frankiales bacterium]|nr:hypothetical protein [Frankiales bacterium]
MELKNGARLRSQVDATEVIVVRAVDGDVDLSCGGHPMLELSATAAEGLTAADGLTGGTQLGKRYTNEAGAVELLVTKPGTGTLTLDGEALDLKTAKPLPASD